MNFQSLKSFDWRALQRFFSPQAADDLNAFLEKLPVNVGQTMLVICGIVWVGAAGLGLYTTVKMQEFAQLRNDLEAAQSVVPKVPDIKDQPVAPDQVKNFVDNISKVYANLKITAQGSVIEISARSTAQYGEFREAIGHIQNGGAGWRVNLESLCVGSECVGEQLKARMKINKVTVDYDGGT